MVMNAIVDFVLGAFVLAIPFWIVQTEGVQTVLDTIVDIVPTKN